MFFISLSECITLPGLKGLSNVSGVSVYTISVGSMACMKDHFRGMFWIQRQTGSARSSQGAAIVFIPMSNF